MNIKIFKLIILIAGIIGLIVFTLLYFIRIIGMHEYIWPLLAFELSVAILYNVDKLKKLGIGKVFFETRKGIDQFRNETRDILQKVEKVIDKDELQRILEIMTSTWKFRSPKIKDIEIKVQETIKVGETIKANVLKMQIAVNKVEVLVDKAEKELSGKISAKSNFRGNLEVIKKKNDKRKT